MAATYGPEDIQSALEAGLITQQDAEYLAQGLEPGAPVGGALGGIAGGVAGGLLGGKAGGAIGKRAFGEAARSGPRTLDDIMAASRTQKEVPPLGSVGSMDEAAAAGEGLMGNMSSTLSELARNSKIADKNAMSEIGGFGAGATLGGLAGGMAGDAIMPSSGGEGLGGRGTFNPATGTMGLDRNKALEMLADPNVPDEAKAQIYEQLKALDKQQDPVGIGKGFPYGGLVGGLGGAALGGLGGAKLGKKYFDASGKEGAIGALVGALGGGAVGQGVGDMVSPARPSPYQNPLMTDEEQFMAGRQRNPEFPGL